MELPFAESWKIKMVEPIRKSTREERERWLKEADYNVFMLRADQVYIDCLTDSGTGAMSDRQWAAMMTGDESYAGARSFYELKDTITRITGFEYVIPTHQGRAAENVLFSHLVKNGDIVPGNSHFDTTKGHIESRKAFAVDCTVDEAKNTQLEIPFKGNVDLNKLENVLAKDSDKIPFIIVTITNNTAGGQPVSMENLRGVRKLADKYGKRVVFDSARFAENAYFIKTREPESTAALFLLTLSRDDGRVRIFHMAAVALGGGAYFLTLSRLALPALLWAAGLARRIWRLLTAPLRALARWTKKFLENRKKLFQNWLAWYKINMVYRFLENGKEGAAGYEAQTGGRRHKNTRAGAAGRGGHRSAVHTGPAQRRPGGPGGAQPPGSGAEGGQRRFGRGHRPKRRH